MQTGVKWHGAMSTHAIVKDQLPFHCVLEKAVTGHTLLVQRKIYFQAVTKLQKQEERPPAIASTLLVTVAPTVSRLDPLLQCF